MFQNEKKKMLLEHLFLVGASLDNSREKILWLRI